MSGICYIYSDPVSFLNMLKKNKRLVQSAEGNAVPAFLYSIRHMAGRVMICNISAARMLHV